jgi:putative transposase
MSWKKLLESISESLNDHLRLRNAYLMAENRLLRRQLDGRVQLTDGERKELAEIGARLGKKALVEIATVASSETILAWNRKFADRKVDTSAPRQSVGRPCVDKEIEGLVVRMARENRSWGYDRIQGTVKHLGYPISDQTVGNILKRHSIPPAPERTKTTTWKEFIRIHTAILGATDFFTSAVWSGYQRVISAGFFFIHCGAHTRPVVGMQAVRYARWMVLIPWHPAAARWVRSVLSQGLAPLLQCGTPVRWCLRATCIPSAPPERLPQGMGSVGFWLVVDHYPIRDGPRRRGPQCGGLRASNNRAAA